MSASDTLTTPDDALLDDVIVEDVVPVSPAQRSLEVAAFITALAALFLLLNNLLYLYSALKLQKDQGSPAPGFSLTLQYLQSIVAQQAYVLAVLPLLTMGFVATVRGIWPSMARSRDRTVVSATLAIIVGLVVLLLSLFNAINSLVTSAATSQLGTSPEARLTSMTGNLFAAVLAIGAIAIGAIFIATRNTDDDALLDEDEDETVAPATDASPADEARPETATETVTDDQPKA